MEKQYLLFSSDGFSYYIGDTQVFLSAIDDATLKAFYVFNYYYFLLESANRFLREVKNRKESELMEEDAYVSLKNTINLFRDCGRISEDEIDEMETATIMSFSFTNDHFSNN